MSAQVLIADDDPVVRHLLSSVLKAAGNTVDLVSSGTECIEYFSQIQESGELPDVLFLDLQLEDMPGTEVLSQIRKLKVLEEQHLPVVMLSGNSESEILRKYPDLSVDCFMEKPFPPDQVAKVLASVLESTAKE